MIEQDLGDLAPRLDVAWATAQDFLAQALCFQVQALDLAVDSGSEEALAEDLASEEAEVWVLEWVMVRLLKLQECPPQAQACPNPLLKRSFST